METQKITIQQNVDCKYYKDVYVNNECMGSVMANDTMTAKDCFEALQNNWAIDELESENDFKIDYNSNY